MRIIILTILCALGCAQQQTALSLQSHDPCTVNATIEGNPATGSSQTPRTRPDDLPAIFSDKPATQQHQSARLKDARAFARQVHELGEQLVAKLSDGTTPDPANQPIIMIFPFRPLDGSRQTSILGTYIAMQLTAHCAQQGLAAQEQHVFDVSNDQANITESYRIEGTYHVNAGTITLSGWLINQHTTRIVNAATKIVAATPFVHGLLRDESLQENTAVPIRDPL
ncbi:hypothetical protein [Desulfoplanes formicivorans]|uniref:FlgO domain-containing protein n=1 Tax=Desulfoplanes formicivorans TaxID=1592317 RepID=A0A194AFE5_9BACT|nr:hypothetical protein [Desulfoplanes formicivorans]GAU08792.1 hypothetical protein DPF_1509 [Desulfoplanes formicivorans]